jgi:hypothetical protein
MKKSVSLMAIIGMTAGGSAPMLWGDTNFLDGWSILGGLIGGFAGIWLGVFISKRY